MTDLWAKLKQRKLVQWALAYIAFAFAFLQGIDIVAAKFAWPDVIERLLIIALIIGLFLTVLLAWYHGERGEQRVTGMEITLLAVLLAIGGGFLWYVGRPVMPATTHEVEQTAITAQATSANASSTVNVPPKSIAVLPFQNLSSDKNNAYFANGMQDLILTKLAGIGDLKVISRTSTAKYASRPDDLKAVAQQLGVATHS